MTNENLFATQDNTQISIKATMDMFFGENAEDHTYGQVNMGDIFTLNLDAGDVFNLSVEHHFPAVHFTKPNIIQFGNFRTTLPNSHHKKTLVSQIKIIH